MNFNRNNRKTGSLKPAIRAALAEYDRATVLRQVGQFLFTIADALTGVMVFGATGSGKTSGPGAFLALAYLAYGFGGLVLCAKPGERRQWEEWAALTGRSDDLIIVDKSGKWRFNFLNHEAARPGEGAGLTLNIVALLEEIAQAVAGTTGRGSGDSQFWGDSLRLLITSAVDLCLFAGLPVSMPNLRDIVTSAPVSLEEVASEAWQAESACWKAMQAAAARKAEMSSEALADLKECVTYFTREFPGTSSRTRGIFVLMFAQLTRPFTTRPLRRLFCQETNITPEACFDGKIVIVDLPIQEFRLIGRVAALAWKASFQAAVLRRSAAPVGSHLRPVFLWADECQNFITDRDAEYQAVARSAGGCTVYLTQNRESLRRVLGSDDTVDAFLGNMQCKFFCQNSGETNEYAAKLLGERWKEVEHSGISYGSGTGGGHTETAEQRRFYVEPARLATLKKGGPANGREVETVVYNGGIQYDLHDLATGKIERVPYALLTLTQEG